MNLLAELPAVPLATLFMLALGVTLALLLAIANKRLYVEEDPRIDIVEGLLPSTNCGACGSPGCRPFAEELIAKVKNPGMCTVSDAATLERIANFLGAEMELQEKRVARLACAGGSHIAHIRAHYEGMKSCRAAALVSGGGKGCTWGCLGMADCEVVCEFDAISMNGYGLPVVDEARCTACGDCVEVCPKDLFELHTVSHQLFVACKNLEKGEGAEAECDVICSACERCVQDSPENLIEIRDNLAVIDYSKNELASRIAIERCPTGAIVWFDRRGGHYSVGKDAKKIIRKQPLPIG
jgi:electron transport complex protein RnfB